MQVSSFYIIKPYSSNSDIQPLIWLCFPRKKRTTAENQKLQHLQTVLNQIELGLSADVKLLRAGIETASIVLMEAK